MTTISCASHCDRLCCLRVMYECLAFQALSPKMGLFLMVSCACCRTQHGSLFSEWLRYCPAVLEMWLVIPLPVLNTKLLLLVGFSDIETNIEASLCGVMGQWNQCFRAQIRMAILCGILLMADSPKIQTPAVV